MPYTLANLFDDVNKRIVDESGGTATTGIVASYANEALRNIRRKWDLPSSKYVSQLVVYDGVFAYPQPTGYKEFANLSYQQLMGDLLSHRYCIEPDFWRNLVSNQVSISDSRNGLERALLVNLNGQLNLANVNLHSCDTFNGNGTWVANTSTSDAATVATDTLYFREGSGSVKFNITVGQSVSDYAEISNSTMTAVDLSVVSVANVGTMFAWVYLPSSTAYTSFTMRWGSSDSAYYESTVTTQFSGATFVQGWNQLGFDWSTATTTGSPSNSAIDFLLFRATYAASFSSQTGLRIDQIIMRQKSLLNLHYYSDYLVIDGTTATAKETFTSATDISSYFNADPSFVDWLLYQVLEDIYTNVIIFPAGVQSYANKRLGCEEDIYRRFPSQKPGMMTNYSETDDLQSLLN